MAETLNYKLEKYDAGSSANLLDQYNSSMDKVDAALKQINDKAEQAGQENALPDGLEAFTVTDLANAKKTAEGFIIPGNVE